MDQKARWTIRSRESWSSARSYNRCRANAGHCFSRIDEAAAEARSLREEVMSREEQVSAARLSSAQQQQVWARHDALRCEERDQARLNAEKAEERARAAGEARASAEADRARLREQLAVSEAESRRAHTEATRSTQQLIAAQAEMAKAQEVHAAAVAQLREELARERERAVAAEARYRELEPERDSSPNREVATLSERLTAALSERRTADEAAKQAEEMRDMLREECVHCLSRTRPAWNPTCQLSLPLPPPLRIPSVAPEAVGHRLCTRANGPPAWLHRSTHPLA